MHHAGCGAGGNVLARFERRERVGDALGQLAGMRRSSSVALGVRRGPGIEGLLPGGPLGCAALDERAGVREDLVGDHEACSGSKPSTSFDGGELVGAEGGAVDLAVFCLSGTASR